MLLLKLSWVLLSFLNSADLDSDGDGLSDFHEVHKYGTNPTKVDSDGDGTSDFDWGERREYAYTVRSLVQVMRPVTAAYLNDDFQDARVLFEASDYVELEVILYPYNSVNDAIEGNPDWRNTDPDLKRWLEPGATSDWTPEMRKLLLAALLSDGIDVAKLDDKQLVQLVSNWLMERTRPHTGFTSFITSFDELGSPFVEDGLRSKAEAGLAPGFQTLAEQWRRELSARGMLEAKERGSCSSTAILLSGCLRALGIPTRSVLCIPLVDANDERELAWVEGRLRHHKLRGIVAASTRQAIGSWTSHTLNEVWVGGRWRRLNYGRLGQNTLDEQCLGLMVHVATFHDWADAGMPATIGQRAGTKTQDELFGGPNPYSCISLSDAFGVHCDLENQTVPPQSMTVHALLWTDDTSLPSNIVANCKQRGRFGFIAVLADIKGPAELRRFLAAADLRIELLSAGQASIEARFDPNCWWIIEGSAFVFVPIGRTERDRLMQGVDYQALAQNASKEHRWALDLSVQR